MATTCDFSPVRLASWTNAPADRRPDEVVSEVEVAGRRCESLCRLAGSLCSIPPEHWIRDLRADLQSDGACVFLQDPASGELQLYAFEFPPGIETLQKGTPIAFN